MIQMSVVTDSPVHSSSSDDFIAYLDAALDASSPEASSDKEVENPDEFGSVRCFLLAVSYYYTRPGMSSTVVISPIYNYSKTCSYISS